MATQKDILIYFSDQHSGTCTSVNNNIVRTPNFDKLCKLGTSFSNAYTSFPLCCPSRMAFMTGQSACKLGIFDNEYALDSNLATFCHSVGSAGYQTTLIGRMHFNSYDQRHGFINRLTGDITPIFQNRTPLYAERGNYVDTLADGLLDIIGKGNSPVIEYDKQVIKDSLDYLDKPSYTPQLICVGTYAPHHTYVAPDELYDYYYDALKDDITISCNELNYLTPYLCDRKTVTDKELIRKAKAAYYGLIEFNDQNLGKVYDKFNDYLSKNNKEGIFIYISDHGDEIGNRGLFGKMTLFENSVKIPLVVTGCGVNSNKCVESPVSILDLCPTICQIAKAQYPPDQEGESLYDFIFNNKKTDTDRVVTAEIIENISRNINTSNKHISYGKMVRWQNWKYITYSKYSDNNLLFDIEKDPFEKNNIAKSNKDLVIKLQKIAASNYTDAEYENCYKKTKTHLKIQQQFAQKNNLDSNERWICPHDKMVFPTE